MKIGELISMLSKEDPKMDVYVVHDYLDPNCETVVSSEIVVGINRKEGDLYGRGVHLFTNRYASIDDNPTYKDEILEDGLEVL